jgi:DNA-directed RNA polymerase subunit RPC12/RpoP
MNKVDQKKFLASLKSVYTCSDCKATFSEGDVVFLDSVEQFDYAELTCPNCGKKTLLRIAKSAGNERV